MQPNFLAGSKNWDQHKTFWDLSKDKALIDTNIDQMAMFW